MLMVYRCWYIGWSRLWGNSVGSYWHFCSRSVSTWPAGQVCQISSAWL